MVFMIPPNMDFIRLFTDFEFQKLHEMNQACKEKPLKHVVLQKSVTAGGCWKKSVADFPVINFRF